MRFPKLAQLRAFVALAMPLALWPRFDKADNVP